MLSVCCESPALTSIKQGGENQRFVQSDLHQEVDGVSFPNWQVMADVAMPILAFISFVQLPSSLTRDRKYLNFILMLVLEGCGC